MWSFFELLDQHSRGRSRCNGVNYWNSYLRRPKATSIIQTEAPSSGKRCNILQGEVGYTLQSFWMLVVPRLTGWGKGSTLDDARKADNQTCLGMPGKLRKAPGYEDRFYLISASGFFFPSFHRPLVTVQLDVCVSACTARNGLTGSQCILKTLLSICIRWRAFIEGDACFGINF